MSKTVVNEFRLADIGYSVGIRLLEYIAWKDKGDKYLKRDTNTVRYLQFIATTVWKMYVSFDAFTFTRSIFSQLLMF